MAESLDSTTADMGNDGVQQCRNLLKAQGIKVVAFDMDQTAVSIHSRGRLRRGDPLENFLNKATEDFKKLVPFLHRDGFGLSIATHSDEAEFGILVKPETHILGSELARALISKYFPSEIVDSFFLVAYNPRARPDGHKEENKIKRYHIRKLIEHFQVEPHEILFLDDTKKVVEDLNKTCGVKAFLVDEKKGFELSDILDNLS
ncbi:Inherit from apiNOG: P36-like protein [Seminavis robusta]|uniref:Inherit from apiNOG: P36-like protein n=1 Tax=Seminavis robusta TaxID=568900 RepID=A0A9N8DG91_9STRA|nr:Inherit from apiNOG: P36-like protein [Seminavis robusta]|eukprot:Sro104_g052880.1 Inherit from apiNOG: P36-like protein (203) ;mRNA; r:67928-68536